MSRPGSRRSYLAALGAGIAVIAASTYGVSLTRAAQDISSAGAPTAVTASAVVPASTPAASTPAGSMPAGSMPSSTAPAQSSLRTAASGSRAPAAGAPSSPTTTPADPSTSAAPAGQPSRTSAPASQAPAPSSAAPAAGQFKDGTYSATAEYNSPGGVEKVGVTVLLAGDVVTGSSLQLFGTGIAKSYQNLFQRSYAPQVTGKKIDTIELAAVGGSSLTSGGFNAALEAIEAQARA